MKDGLLFTQLPFLDSPSLKDAVDNAPDLSGVDLNAPLLSSISTTAADISRDSVETFATSPSLFKAILRYILHYEFDVSEFLELLDTLDEIRIPSFRKQDNVDLVSSARTLRDFDITSLSVGSPPETRAAFDASDISTQLGNGSINELIAPIDADPLIDKVPNRSLSERVDVLLNLPLFKRGTDIGEDFFSIPPVNLATGQGEFFSLAQTKAREDFFFAESKRPLVLVGDIFTARDAVDLISSQRYGYQPVNEFEVGVAGSGDDADGFPYCDPRILPGYREFVHAASRTHTIAKTTPAGSVLADTLYMLPDEVRKKFALDVSFRGLDNEIIRQAGPNYLRHGDILEYEFLVEEEVFKQAKSSAFENLFTKSAAPTVVKPLGPFKESLFTESEKFGFEIGAQLAVAAATESFPRKRVPATVEELAKLKESLVFKGKFFAPPETQKFKVQEDEPRNKIVLDFLIEKTFWSVHSNLAGFIVASSNGDFVWVDLGEKYDKPIYHSSVTLDSDGNPIDDEGNPYVPDNQGWPSNTHFYRKNERYIQTTARSNMGRLRQGRESAIYPEYRDRYGSTIAELLGKQERISGYPVQWAFTDDAIERLGENTLAATDAPRVQGEGAEFLTRYFSGFGYGHLRAYGPAPRKWTYDYHGASGPNRQKRWAKRDGIYYLQYVHQTTHQDSGRRINLLLREMTTEDENTSNLYGGKKQIMTGPTFIDRMLQTAYWGEIFRKLEGIVQIQGNPTTEDSFVSKDRLNNIGLGPTNYIPTEKLKIGFLHRYESELMAEPLFDIELKYTYHLHDEKAGADGNRYWPYNVAPLYRQQPADWDSKVRLKSTADFEDSSSAKSLKPFIFNGATQFERDIAFAEDTRDKNKIGKRVTYTVTRTPLVGEDEDGNPVYGPPVTTVDDETVHIIPATFAPVYDPRDPEVILYYNFVKGEAFQINRNNSVQDNATAKMLQAIITKAPKDSISDRIFAISEPATAKPSPEIEQQVGVQLDQGYFEEQTVHIPFVGPTTEIVFVPKPKISQKNTLVNEVAAADSGTAFVPVYCLPSYFMETYVGEDGKFANF